MFGMTNLIIRPDCAWLLLAACHVINIQGTPSVLPEALLRLTENQ